MGARRPGLKRKSTLKIVDAAAPRSRKRSERDSSIKILEYHRDESKSINYRNRSLKHMSSKEEGLQTFSEK